jgi:hypothetical protein
VALASDIMRAHVTPWFEGEALVDDRLDPGAGGQVANHREWLGVAGLCLAGLALKFVIMWELNTFPGTFRDISWSGMSFFIWMFIERKVPPIIAEWKQSPAILFILFLASFVLIVQISKWLTGIADLSSVVWIVSVASAFLVTYVVPGLLWVGRRS